MLGVAPVIAITVERHALRLGKMLRHLPGAGQFTAFLIARRVP